MFRKLDKIQENKIWWNNLDIPRIVRNTPQLAIIQIIEIGILISENKLGKFLIRETVELCRLGFWSEEILEYVTLAF